MYYKYQFTLCWLLSIFAFASLIGEWFKFTESMLLNPNLPECPMFKGDSFNLLNTICKLDLTEFLDKDTSSIVVILCMIVGLCVLNIFISIMKSTFSIYNIILNFVVWSLSLTVIVMWGTTGPILTDSTVQMYAIGSISNIMVFVLSTMSVLLYLKNHSASTSSEHNLSLLDFLFFIYTWLLTILTVGTLIGHWFVVTAEVILFPTLHNAGRVHKGDMYSLLDSFCEKNMDVFLENSATPIVALLVVNMVLSILNMTWYVVHSDVSRYNLLMNVLMMILSLVVVVLWHKSSTIIPDVEQPNEKIQFFGVGSISNTLVLAVTSITIILFKFK